MGIGLGIALGAQALGGVLGGRSNRKAAKKAAKENRRLEAITNLISIAGGQGPTGFGQEQAVGGSTLSDILSGGGQAAGALIQQQAQEKIAADEVTAKQLLRDQQILESKSRVDSREAQSAMAQMEQLFNISNSGLNGKTSSGGGKGRLGTSLWGIDKGVLPNMNASFFPGQGVLDTRPTRASFGIN
tara:strand:- start:311 stop:871 length:561 start_codon:yes stop_codon:yes gene_type:complete